MIPRKKLIEVALPLPEINDASAYDKMPGIGPHPKGIHHWWARLPLPTARGVLFASVVDDPEAHPEKWPTEEAQNVERERIFAILRQLMGKKLHEAPEAYAAARAEMLRHCDGRLPTVFDPFAGGGSIPLEANRLGFATHAGDLNPVAVLLNKCNLELAPRWAGRAPVNPVDHGRIGGGESWHGTHGLAADVRYYGRVVRERALAAIGHLYPKIRLERERGGGEAAVIAWIWARTVASPDPAARGKHVPLISTYWLSSKKGNLAWLEPVVDSAAGTYRFDVRTGTPSDRTWISAGTKAGRGERSVF
jgi:putative DNA methylase